MLINCCFFSVINDFVNRMKILFKVIIIGDKIGGGFGLFFFFELFNGWFVCFLVSFMYDVDM